MFKSLKNKLVKLEVLLEIQKNKNQYNQKNYLIEGTQSN